MTEYEKDPHAYGEDKQKRDVYNYHLPFFLRTVDTQAPTRHCENTRMLKLDPRYRVYLFCEAIHELLYTGDSCGLLPNKGELRECSRRPIKVTNYTP